MGDRFFKSLNYSSVNEDWRTEAAGLQIGEKDSILCVTGSGARPLDLLMHDPESITAIDKNPSQNHLLSLKMAAIERFSFDEYAAFLGLRKARGWWREQKLKQLLTDLGPDSRTFWKKHTGIIQAGVIYQGRWERNYRSVAKFARMIRPRKIPKLFEFKSIEEQQVFVRDHWDTRFWRLVNAAVCSPVTSRIFFRDPAFYKYVEVPVAMTLYNRMLSSLIRCPARENFMISLVLRGFLSDHDLPPHLTPQGYEYIGARLSRIQTVTSGLDEFLYRNPRPEFTRYSLSDVPSYISRSGFESLLNGILRTAKPSARIVIRQFLTRYKIPPSFEPLITRDPQLEAQLTLEDKAFAYNLIIGEIDNA